MSENEYFRKDLEEIELERKESSSSSDNEEAKLNKPKGNRN